MKTGGVNPGDRRALYYLVRGLGLKQVLEIGTFLTYLDECDESFDLIFLDGDHTAAMVYQEVPRALRRLREIRTLASS